MITREELDKMKALDALASPGPWMAFEPPDEGGYAVRRVYRDGEDRRCVSFPVGCFSKTEPNKVNAEWIAAARDLMPKLLNERMLK